MSNLSEQVIGVIKEIYPQLKLKREEYVKFKNQKLYLDIWLPQLGLVVEVHGRQHDEFVEHFHGSNHAFMDSKRRDRLKEEWAAEQGLTYIVIREKDLPLTKERFLEILSSEES